MATTGVTLETFCDRWHGCSYFKERSSYIRTATKVIRKSLKWSDGTDFMKTFSSTFSRRSYTGLENIYSGDVKSFREFCLSCAMHINEFLKQVKFLKLVDSYNYRWKLRGTIDGIVELNGKQYHLVITLYNSQDTEKILDRAKFNSYIYNQVNGTSNDCIVFSAQSNTFYVLYYSQDDFSMNRGFLSSLTKNKQRVPGPMCRFCKNKCKPVFIKGLYQLKNWEFKND